jgi:hypothetical protein
MTAPVSYSVLSTTDLKVWTTTGVTTTTGALTVTVPADTFSSVLSVQATCVRNTATASGACFAVVRSYSPTSIVVHVFESKTTSVSVNGTVEGLEATTTATTVLLTVFGI